MRRWRVAGKRFSEHLAGGNGFCRFFKGADFRRSNWNVAGNDRCSLPWFASWPVQRAAEDFDDPAGGQQLDHRRFLHVRLWQPGLLETE
jgi:hypothetical protein